MSSLARYFKSQGKKVSGYDKTETELTKQLIQEGIGVHYEENIELIPKDVELVVYTPAIPGDHKELVYFQENNYPILKRSDVLGLVTDNSFNICVAGTHGKTTISSMIAHILRHTGYGCNAFLGGIAVNYNSNFWSNDRNVCVVEADEYDRSFLKLNPDIAVITAMDADHLDIYGTEAAMQEAYIEFSGRVREGGLLVSKFGLPTGRRLKAKKHLTYSLQNRAADTYASNIRIMHGGYEFDVSMKEWMIDNVVLNMGGMHNIENAVVSIAIGRHLGLGNHQIKNAVRDFKGVKRRFEYVVKRLSAGAGKANQPSVVYVDDYAHHPEELKALITGARSLFGKMRCTIIFQPHLFTRTRDFAEEFAASLDLTDETILLPIYPARELPIEGVTSELILKNIRNKNAQLIGKEEVLEFIKEKFIPQIKGNDGNLLITAGAGDIDTLVLPIKEIIERN